MIKIQDNLLKDMEAVRQIPIVPTMLEVICQTTGMGFAAIARVTSDRWMACSVRDDISLGLQEGGELKIDTTICNEIRGSRKAVIIDHVDEDQHFKDHPTPKMYGFQSYISVPIILKNGKFFGTLCALDPKPAKVNNTRVIGTFTMFADLLSFHLQSRDLLERSYHANKELNDKNRALIQVNNDLDTFVYTASHDLKSPINNMEGLLNALSNTIEEPSLDKEKAREIIAMMNSSVGRLRQTIQDLTTIVAVDGSNNIESPQAIDLHEIIDDVKKDLSTQIEASKAKIEVVREENLLFKFSRKNLKSILYNLLSNGIKYSSPDRCPELQVKLWQCEGKINLSVQDNGLGIPPDKQDKVFSLFKRFHDHVEGSGIGLFLVKRIIDHEGGQIKVDSSQGKGTTFTIIF